MNRNTYLNRPFSSISAALLSVLLLSCAGVNAQVSPSLARDVKNPVLMKENWFTTWSPAENIDSPATWHGPDGQHWLLATGKESHSVLIYDAVNGAPITRIGGAGNQLGQFNRPNGLFTIDNLLFVVERDNRRVQVLTLPDMIARTSFGDEELVKPYGLWINKTEKGKYSVYVTDSYDAGNEDNSKLSEMGKRVRLYEVEVEGTVIDGEHISTFGDTAGSGVLHVVESIWGDKDNNILLIADEDMERGQNIKVYDLDGNFTGQVIGTDIFKYQPEGIALFSKNDGNGYWIFADQGKVENLFHVFDRKSLKHLSTFEGSVTLNTDGIWLSQKPMLRFPEGVLYAVHNDGAVAAFSVSEIFEAIGLKP